MRKELWENPFANAHLKVERANKHIADIEERLRTSSDNYGPSLHFNMTAGQQELHYGFTDHTLRSDIALAVGDAVHNLHSALDIVWYGAVGNMSPAARTRRTKFPIYEQMTRDQLETTLVKGQIHAKLVSFVVDTVKTYGGGDEDILALH